MLKIDRHYTISSVVRQRKTVNAYIPKFCSASGVKIYSVNLDHETTFITLDQGGIAEWGMMHSLLQVPVKSAVFGRFCFARAYRDRSETYRQRNINSKHTVQNADLGYVRLQPRTFGDVRKASEIRRTPGGLLWVKVTARDLARAEGRRSREL